MISQARRKTPKPRVPQYCRHKTSGQGVVYFARRPYYLGPYGSDQSLQAYARLIAEWRAAGHPPNRVAPADLTVTELVAAHWQWARDYYVRSEQRCIRLAAKPLLRLYGLERAADFGPIALDAVRNAMIDAGWARSTINGQVGRLRAIFRWGVARELVGSEVHQRLAALAGLRRGKTTARESDRIEAVAEADVRAIAPHVAAPVWAMVRIQWLTGMRSGELVILRGQDISFGADAWTYRPATHKTDHRGHDRTIDLGPQARAVLADWLTGEPEAYVFRPPRGPGCRDGTHYRAKPPGGRTGRRLGERYTPVSYRRAIVRACRAAGIEPWTPHRLRHSFAERVRESYGIEAASAALGHRSVDVTEIYAARNRTAARRVAREVG